MVRQETALAYNEKESGLTKKLFIEGAQEMAQARKRKARHSRLCPVSCAAAMDSAAMACFAWSINWPVKTLFLSSVCFSLKSAKFTNLGNECKAEKFNWKGEDVEKCYKWKSCEREPTGLPLSAKALPWACRASKAAGAIAQTGQRRPNAPKTEWKKERG